MWARLIKEFFIMISNIKLNPFVNFSDIVNLKNFSVTSTSYTKVIIVAIVIFGTLELTYHLLKKNIKANPLFLPQMDEGYSMVEQNEVISWYGRGVRYLIKNDSSQSWKYEFEIQEKIAPWFSSGVCNTYEYSASTLMIIGKAEMDGIKIIDKIKNKLIAKDPPLFQNVIFDITKYPSDWGYQTISFKPTSLKIFTTIENRLKSYYHVERNNKVYLIH